MACAGESFLVLNKLSLKHISSLEVVRVFFSNGTSLIFETFYEISTKWISGKQFL